MPDEGRSGEYRDNLEENFCPVDGYFASLNFEHEHFATLALPFRLCKRMLMLVLACNRVYLRHWFFTKSPTVLSMSAPEFRCRDS